jgi:ferredoxin
MKTIRVTVDETLCIAAACCVGILPSVFSIGEASVAEVPGDGTIQVDETDLAKVEDAVDSCPTRAISFEEI